MQINNNISATGKL